MELFTQYKIIFFLSSILVIISILGEILRVENLKEGFSFGKLLKPLKKLTSFFTAIGKLGKWLGVFFFKWVPAFVMWILQYVMCAFYKIIGLPNCFLWYSLHIFGKMLYLPFRIVFFFLDLILQMFRLPFRIQKIVDRIWLFADDISHFGHSLTGYHFIHFPDDVIKKCYKCKIGKFPKIPKFPKIKL